jgi:uncharacterized membrane-anchored protein
MKLVRHISKQNEPPQGNENTRKERKKSFSFFFFIDGKSSLKKGKEKTGVPFGKSPHPL